MKKLFHVLLLGLGLAACAPCKPAANTHHALGFPGPYPPTAAQGSTLYFGASTFPSVLAPSSNGSCFISGGGGANPLWGLCADADQGVITSPPLAASWTHINFAGATTITDSGTASFPTVFLSDFTTGGAENSHSAVVVTPGSTWTLIARFRPLLIQANNSAAGLVITDGTKLIELAYTFNSGGMLLQVSQKTNSTTFSSNPFSVSWNLSQNASSWFKWQNNSTNRLYSVSSDGVNWWQFRSEASGLFLTETEIGIVVNPQSGGGGGITLESWKLTTP